MKITEKAIKSELRKSADPEYVKQVSVFFKTAKGQYGEGDKFIGIRVPVLRKCVKKMGPISLCVLEKLIESKIHEERLFALLSLVNMFEKGDEKEKKIIYDFYLNHTENINNWDLVDLSFGIVGKYLEDRDRNILYKLAKSANLWERRIAIVSTYCFIRNHDFNDTLKIAEMLLNDQEDLIHKAVGWMLRELGKRDQKTEEKFLEKHYKNMPRTMLRYAIERFPEKKRQAYLKGKI